MANIPTSHRRFESVVDTQPLQGGESYSATMPSGKRLATTADDWKQPDGPIYDLTSLDSAGNRATV